MAKQFRETYAYFDSEGNKKTIRICGRNKQDTDLKFQQFIMNAEKAKAAISLSQFIETIYIPKFMATLSPTTQYSYKQFINHNIKPFMGEKPMDQIDVSVVQEFMNWMATAGTRDRKNNLNFATINRVCELVSRMYAIALEMKIVTDNPVKWKLLRNPGAPATHHKAATDEDVEEVKKKIPSIPTEQERLYAALIIYTGLRKEEVMGLRWENIDLNKRIGEVIRAVTYAGNSRLPIVKTPKTIASARVFIIPEALADILSQCTKKQGYIIHGRDSEEPACYSTQQRIYRRSFTHLGIYGKYSNHDWRATFGTQLKESGLTSAQVADMLGHSDTRMVETVYAPARKEGVIKNAAAVEALNKKSINK